MRMITANTLLWLREKSYDRGTAFVVVDTVDEAATDPVQVDAGTAALWVRQHKAVAGAGDATPAARKAR